jgi:PAS domain S-box-containing protein
MRDSLRILNLEDDANDAELNQAMISARWPDCEFVQVCSRSDYLAALEQGGFAVILSDYTMPGFDGREALTLARLKCPETPFLFVSGTIGEDSAIEALKHGATDYVLKHRLMRLIPALDRALQEAVARIEYQRADEAMRQSEYKYRELFECLSDAAFLADEQSGKIIDTNRSAQTILGCTRAAILGRKESEFLALDQLESRADAEKARSFRCQMQPMEGRAFPVEVRTTRLTLYGRPLLLRLCLKCVELDALQTSPSRLRG